MGASTDSPDDPDRILTVLDGPEVEEVVKGSRFLAQTFRVRSEDEALGRLDEIRSKYPDATHHCWAARIGDPRRPVTRCDDDGEPNRTAGAPILLAIESAAVSDVLVIVTRYFGGTKLGKGGLVRAYGAAARRALNDAPRSETFRHVSVRIVVSYDDLGSVEGCLAKQARWIRDIDRTFESSPTLSFEVRRSRAESLRTEVREATSGRAEIEVRREEAT
ncbi:MAG: YigZ family protein [Planctomycetes bacterium]|nr:YigZ family protein [Planctomycetota bacterium]